MKIKSSTLTRYLQAAGLTSKEAKNIADLFLKWYRSNGPEWTNSRWKDLRQWYETYLTGKPVPAPWFSVTKGGTPKGVLGAIFKLSPERALLALSINTLLISDKESEEQSAKFRKGLGGNGTVLTKELRELIREEFKVARVNLKLPKFDGTIRLPDWIDVSGNRATVPLRNGKSFSLKPYSKQKSRISDAESKTLLAKAIQLSWAGCPEVTMEFLWDSGHLDWVPVDVIGNEYALDLNHFPLEAGKIGHIQQPQLKERNVLSPNVVTQVTTEPLGKLWYTCLNRLGYTPKRSSIPGALTQNVARDCYRNQEAGIEWVQAQLRSGVEMSGTDLSSATDLLNLDACLEIIHTVWLAEYVDDEEYMRHVQYFKKLARAPYWDGKDVVSWKQGQPLGLYPSFALLGLVNNAIARLACIQAGLTGNEYCALGDDMIIDTRAVSNYKRWIELIGGEINTSKTLTSNKVAEFAGRIILPDRCILKATKLSDIGVSDDQFMQFMLQAGDSGRRLLLPRQRKMWDTFKYVPGVLTDPYRYSDNGYGEPLSYRYAWYLLYVATEDRILPDRHVETDAGIRQLKVNYTLGLDMGDNSLPYPIEDLSYQLSDLTDHVHCGDPRKFYELAGRASLLDFLEDIANSPYFLNYEEYKAMELSQNVKVLSSESHTETTQ